MNVRIIFIAFLLILVAGAAGWYYMSQPAGSRDNTPASDTSASSTIKTVATNLSIPWGIAFLPDESILLTERTGTLLHITPDDAKQRIPVDGVHHTGEGGLLGIALHPEYETNRFIYLYLTTRTESGTRNRVVRYRYDKENEALSYRTVIIEGIPGASYHDGGRIAFDPRGEYLYITTGDAGVSDRAQDPDSLAGKILRLHPDGSIPEGNPFDSPVFSYGHRNPQGLAWDPQGRLYATEHGRSGALSGLDELNRITKGANYGWPVIQGGQTRSGMQTPIVHSGPDVTWAPASAVYWNERIWWGGLRGASLYAFPISDPASNEVMRFFHERFGRIRTVAIGPDEHFYITTSNTDGRGDPDPDDDKLIRIAPTALVSESQ